MTSCNSFECFFSFLECWRDVPNCANKLKGLKVHQRQNTIFSKMRQKLFFPIMYLNFNQNVNFCNFRVIMQSKSGFYARKFKYFKLIARPPVSTSFFVFSAKIQIRDFASFHQKSNFVLCVLESQANSLSSVV